MKKLNLFAALNHTWLKSYFDALEDQRSYCILSVTLFSVKIISIVQFLKPGVDCSLYVNDF